MNEPLRRALLRTRLREGDVAARLGVDPKTVRRWLNGRVPYPHNRAAIAELVGVDEAELWPDASGLLAARIRPEELETVYPHRGAVPREVWVQLFGSAEREIAFLAYSALFLAEDAGLNYAIYHDRYQRTGDGWKFTERVYEIRYLDTSPLAGSAPPAAGAPADPPGDKDAAQHRVRAPR